MTKVMVTGARGVLGRRLVGLLNKTSVPVVAFSGDITDLDVVKANIRDHPDITHVFHLAAVVPTTEVEQDFSHAVNVNAYGTGLLMSVLIEANLAPWFCYVSSSHVYQPAKTLLKEDSPCRPSSVYGFTKYLGEKNVQMIGSRYPGAVAIARVFSYFDESQTGPFLYPTWAKKVEGWDGQSELEVFGGDSVRDFSRASDVVRELERLMVNNFEGIVNIGSGCPLKVVDFLKKEFGNRYPFVAKGKADVIVPDLSKLLSLQDGINDQIS